MQAFTHLGNYLRNARMKREFTQRELSAKLRDVHPQYVSNWERGKCPPPSDQFQRLLTVLHVDRTKVVEAMLKDEQEIIRQKIFR